MTPNTTPAVERLREGLTIAEMLAHDVPLSLAASETLRLAWFALDELAARAALDGTRGNAGEDDDNRTADEAVDFVFDRRAKKLGLAEWQVVKGSEEWEGDVSATLHRLLVDAGIIDNDTGAIATLATSAGEGLTSGEGKTHKIKCWPDVFEEMRAGRKTAEFRYNDRGYAVGDMLLIREWDTATATYTHREITRQITHVLDGGFGMPAGYVMLSLTTSPSQPTNASVREGGE